MDGNFVKWKDAKIHVLTHALLYGSSVFEGIHSYMAEKGVAMFRLSDDIERLFSSAKSFGMNIKFTKPELSGAVKNLIKKNKIKDGYVRPTVYYGYENIGVYPEGNPTNVAISAIPWKKYFQET